METEWNGERANRTECGFCHRGRMAVEKMSLGGERVKITVSCPDCLRLLGRACEGGQVRSGAVPGADAARDEFEPRGSDICPECGSGHTICLRASVPVHDRNGLPRPGTYYACRDCKSHWWVVGEVLETFSFNLLPR